jgi:hypothetical protein
VEASAISRQVDQVNRMSMGVWEIKSKNPSQLEVSPKVILLYDIAGYDCHHAKTVVIDLLAKSLLLMYRNADECDRHLSKRGS